MTVTHAILVPFDQSAAKYRGMSKRGMANHSSAAERYRATRSVERIIKARMTKLSGRRIGRLHPALGTLATVYNWRAACSSGDPPTPSPPTSRPAASNQVLVRVCRGAYCCPMPCSETKVLLDRTLQLVTTTPSSHVLLTVLASRCCPPEQWACILDQAYGGAQPSRVYNGREQTDSMSRTRYAAVTPGSSLAVVSNRILPSLQCRPFRGPARPGPAEAFDGTTDPPTCSSPNALLRLYFAPILMQVVSCFFSRSLLCVVAALHGGALGDIIPVRFTSP